MYVKNAKTDHEELSKKKIVKTADDYFNVGLYNDAINQYKQAALLSLNTHDNIKLSVIQSSIANCYARLGNYEEAERYYKLATQALKDTSKITTKKRISYQRLFTLFIGFLLVIIIFSIFFFAISSSWNTTSDDLRYGRPRTSQIDAVVGHNDSPTHPTHFIFINLQGHIEIIETPGGDFNHTHSYEGPIIVSPGGDLIPVTGEVRDVNHDGKPDLLIHIRDTTVIFINTGNAFQLSTK